MPTYQHRSWASTVYCEIAKTRSLAKMGPVKTQQFWCWGPDSSSYPVKSRRLRGIVFILALKTKRLAVSIVIVSINWLQVYINHSLKPTNYTTSSPYFSIKFHTFWDINNKRPVSNSVGSREYRCNNFSHPKSTQWLFLSSETSWTFVVTCGPEFNWMYLSRLCDVMLSRSTLSLYLSMDVTSMAKKHCTML